jgi:hypothetical protein
MGLSFMSVWAEIQKWYASNCDGQWEEEYGVKIETLDNPGWSVSVDLFETNLEGVEFSSFKKDDSEESWIDCRVEEKQFRGFGDSNRLEEIIKVFLDWAKSQNQDWLKPPPPMTDEEHQTYSDEKLFLSLDDEVTGETCRRAGCRENRIRYSVLCRAHHFEMVTGRNAPSIM